MKLYLNHFIMLEISRVYLYCMIPCYLFSSLETWAYPYIICLIAIYWNNASDKCLNIKTGVQPLVFLPLNSFPTCPDMLPYYGGGALGMDEWRMLGIYTKSSQQGQPRHESYPTKASGYLYRIAIYEKWWYNSNYGPLWANCLGCFREWMLFVMQLNLMIPSCWSWHERNENPNWLKYKKKEERNWTCKIFLV